MKNPLKRCWVYRMYALTTVLIVNLMMSVLNPDQVRNSCNTEFVLGIIEVQETRSSDSCREQQNTDKKENEKVLISFLNLSGPQIPDIPDINCANNGSRYPLLLEEQAPITIECSGTDYNPSSKSSTVDSLIAINYTGLKLPQSSGFYSQDNLHKHSRATYFAREIYIDKYKKKL